MRLIIDRFEGIYAVCEKDDRTMINIEIDRLPSTIKEGDIIILENGIYQIDEKVTHERKQNIEKLMNDLWE